MDTSTETRRKPIGKSVFITLIVASCYFVMNYNAYKEQWHQQQQVCYSASFDNEYETRESLQKNIKLAISCTVNEFGKLLFWY